MNLHAFLRRVFLFYTVFLEVTVIRKGFFFKGFKFEVLIIRMAFYRDLERDSGVQSNEIGNDRI